MATLIADSGSTKCEWGLINKEEHVERFTQGISPYFLSGIQIGTLLEQELLPYIDKEVVTEVFFYGTGCKHPANRRIIKNALQQIFTQAVIAVDTDMMGAARALCGKRKGVISILGTGSSTCYFNGKTIVKNRTGLGYVLGDEGSGAYLGKKVLQYYLYKTFDGDLQYRFSQSFNTTENEILESIYKKPLPNRYMASFAVFLADNRGHYMIENIVEDGLNDFFFQHICKFRESWLMPIHFTGGIAYGFRDVIQELCATYEFELGSILKNPMEGLLQYHAM